MFRLIKSDYLKYKKYGGNFFSILFLTQGFWAILQYRVANYFFCNLKVPLFIDFLKKLVYITDNKLV